MAEETHAERNARSHVEVIRHDIAALEALEQAKPLDSDEAREEGEKVLGGRINGTRNLYAIYEVDGVRYRLTWDSMDDDPVEYVSDPYTLDHDGEAHTDPDDLRDRLMGQALEIGVRSDWVDPMRGTFEPTEYLLLLTTGGPALRITGELDISNEPATLRLQHQDWGTAWTDYPLDDAEQQDLLQFANLFVFGE